MGQWLKNVDAFLPFGSAMQRSDLVQRRVGRQLLSTGAVYEAQGACVGAW